MAMFLFKTPTFIWVAEGDDEVRARAELAETIRREWSGDGPRGEDVALERIHEVAQTKAVRVPHVVRIIRTFPLSDVGVY